MFNFVNSVFLNRFISVGGERNWHYEADRASSCPGAV